MGSDVYRWCFWVNLGHFDFGRPHHAIQIANPWGAHLPLKSLLREIPLGAGRRNLCDLLKIGYTRNVFVKILS